MFNKFSILIKKKQQNAQKSDLEECNNIKCTYRRSYSRFMRVEYESERWVY